MIKLKSIYINGFKEANRQISLTFSDEPVTVIYGGNGSGKTTLLRIIHAIFNKDEVCLFEENIKEIELVYDTKSELDKKCTIKVNNKSVNWGDNIKELTKQTSILFGVNRGVIPNTEDLEYTPHDAYMLERQMRNIRNEYRHNLEYTRRSEEAYLIERAIRSRNRSLYLGEDWYKKNHISVDLIGISDIEAAIIRQSRAGQRATSDKVKNAFFNTISSAVDIEMEKKNYELPVDFFTKDRSKKRYPIIPNRKTR